VTGDTRTANSRATLRHPTLSTPKPPPAAPADAYPGANNVIRLEGALSRACQMAKQHKVAEPDHLLSLAENATREDRQAPKTSRLSTRNGVNSKITLVRYSFQRSRMKMTTIATVKFKKPLLTTAEGLMSGYTKIAHSVTHVHWVRIALQPKTYRRWRRKKRWFRSAWKYIEPNRTSCTRPIILERLLSNKKT